MKIIHTALFTTLLAAGCMSPGTDETPRIAVTSDNTLGIVAIETTKLDDTYTLRALDQDDNEVASIRRRYGVVSSAEGVDVRGFELELAIHKVVTDSVVVHGQEEIRVYANAIDSEVASVLTMNEVRRELARERIVVATPVARNEVAYGYAETCHPSHLLPPNNNTNPTPIAQQCCTDSVEYMECRWAYEYECYVVNDPTRTIFVPDRGNNVGKLIVRQYADRCKRSNGYTNCTSGLSPAQGGDCYYGPHGWAVTAIYAKPTNGDWRTYPLDYDSRSGTPMCDWRSSAVNPTVYFGNVSGTAPASSCGGGGAVGWQGEY